MAASRLAARTSGDYYDNEVHGKPSSGGVPAGDRTINPKATIRLMWPQYHKGEFVFVPFPAVDPRYPDTRLLPGRKSPRPNAQHPWMVKVRTASYVGVEGKAVTFVLYHPKDEKLAYQENPYHVFWNACNSANTSGEFSSGRKWDSDWNKLMKGGKKGGVGIGAAIKRPATRWYCQGAVYRNADEFFVGREREHPLGLDSKDDLVVIQIPESGGNSLIQLLDKPSEKYKGDPAADLVRAFMYNPVGNFDRKAKTITGNRFVTLFNPRITKITKHTSWNGEIDEKRDFQRYEVAISRKFTHDRVEYLPDIDAAGVTQIFDKAWYWFNDPNDKQSEGLIYVPTRAEQALMIAQAFQSVPNLVKFAFAEHSDLMGADVMGVLQNRISAVMPGKDDEDEDTKTPSRGKKAGGKKDVTQQRARVRDDEDEDDPDEEEETDEEDEEEVPVSRGAKKAKKPKKATIVAHDPGDDDDDDDEPDDEEEEDEFPAEDDDEEEEDEAPRSRKKSRKSAPVKATDDDDDDDDDDEPDEDEEDEDEDEEDEEPAPKRRSKVKVKAKAPKARSAKAQRNGDDEDDDDEDDEDAEEEEDDEDDLPKPKGRSSKLSAAGADDEDEEDEDEDEDEEEQEEDEDEEDEPAPKKKAKKGGAVKSSVTKPGKATKTKASNGKSDKVVDPHADDYNLASEEHPSMKSVRAAKARSDDRSAAPTKPAPKPPTSKGGTASRKAAPAIKKKKKGVAQR